MNYCHVLVVHSAWPTCTPWHTVTISRLATDFFSHVSLPFDLFRERPLPVRDHFVNIVACLLFPSLRKLLLINHTSLDQRSNLSSCNHFRGQILFFKITTGFDCLEFPVTKHLIRTWHSKPATQARGEAPRVGRGSGGTPFYKPYRHVSPHRVGFLPRFGLKQVYTLPISPFPVFWIKAPPPKTLIAHPDN